MKSASSLSAKPRAAKSKSVVKKSTAAKVSRAADAAVATRTTNAADEHPEAKVAHIVRGIVRRGLVPVEPKVPITLRVDPDVLEWFKVEGDGYQTRMNAVLRAYRDAASA